MRKRVRSRFLSARSAMRDFPPYLRSSGAVYAQRVARQEERERGRRREREGTPDQGRERELCMKEASERNRGRWVRKRHRPRQRVLARVLSHPWILRLQGRTRQTPVVEHRGGSGVPLRRIIGPGGMPFFSPSHSLPLSISLSRCPLTDAAMITGVSGYLAVRGMSRTHCLPA